MGAALNTALAQRGLPEVARMYLLHCVSRAFFYWLPNALLHTAAKKGWGKQWKIQGSKMPSAELTRKALLHNLAEDLLSQLFISVLFRKILRLGKTHVKAMAAVDPDPKDEEKVVVADSKENVVVADSKAAPVSTSLAESGWARLRFSGPPPGLWTQVWQVAVAFFGYDMMFYWTHRLMHHKRLYKHCHKVHHQFHTPIGISSSHHHTAEGLVQLFNWYLPIGFAGFLNRNSGGLHIATLFYYHCFRWIETVDAHCGYEFPFSPFHILPIFGGARMHDYHHRAFDGNYGASFFWDTLCGTNADFWKEVKDEGGFLIGGARKLLR